MVLISSRNSHCPKTLSGINGEKNSVDTEQRRNGGGKCGHCPLHNSAEHTFKTENVY